LAPSWDLEAPASSAPNPFKLTGMDRIHFTQLVDEALARLPKAFKDKLENLAVIVEDYPDEEVQERFSGTLLGLFHGVPRTQQSFSWAAPPSQIYLYQKNIEAICRSDEDVAREIQKTLEHEIGHYFGLSERDLRRRGY
jgi:predicted Zn-dependent protease with MMP-like domain